MVPSFIIIIGSAYGMHFLSRFLEHEYEGDKKITLIRKTISEEKTPIYFSALTTMAGFISYIFLKMEAFREMGLFIAIGIFLCALFTMNVIPSLLSFSKNTHNHFKKRRKYNLNFPKWLKISFIIFTLVGICAAPFIISAIPLEINSYDYFKDNSQLMRGVHHLEEKFNWVSNFYLMVEQKDSKTFTPSPEDVEQLMEINDRLENIGVVSKSLSIFGLSKSMHLSPNLLLTFIRSNAEGEAYAKTFYSQNAIRYMLFVTSNDSKTAQALVDDINKILEDYPQLQSKYAFFSAGIPLLWSELSVVVVENQIQSLILSFILIFILLLIIFRKLSTALFSAIPIGLTIMFNFVFMGLFKIPLEIPTAIISGMLMGLVIDYAIHFMYWFKKTGNTTDAYEMTASPIIFNGVSLIASFVVLLSAPLMLYVKLAILMVLGIGVGIMTTLVFLPQMLKRFSSTKK
jgi:predicted RND superfamily exporter protein